MGDNILQLLAHFIFRRSKNIRNQFFP